MDLLALGSNKLYGPHGIGALYLSNRVNAANILYGGTQERGLRPGTENVALAAGFATALVAIGKLRGSEKKRVAELRDELARGITKSFSGVVINGDTDRALPHMLNISLPNIQSEYVTLALDKRGVSLSTKSACREGEESRSHVIASMSVENWRAENTLRFSLGRETTSRDISRVLEVLREVLKV